MRDRLIVRLLVYIFYPPTKLASLYHTTFAPLRMQLNRSEWLLYDNEDLEVETYLSQRLEGYNRKFLQLKPLGYLSAWVAGTPWTQGEFLLHKYYVEEQADTVNVVYIEWMEWHDLDLWWNIEWEGIWKSFPKAYLIAKRKDKQWWLPFILALHHIWRLPLETARSWYFMWGWYWVAWYIDKEFFRYPLYKYAFRYYPFTYYRFMFYDIMLSILDDMYIIPFFIYVKRRIHYILLVLYYMPRIWCMKFDIFLYNQITYLLFFFYSIIFKIQYFYVYKIIRCFLLPVVRLCLAICNPCQTNSF